MIKVQQYKVKQIGKRGFAITLPPVYMNDEKISVSDVLPIYIDKINGVSVVIIAPPNSESKLRDIHLKNLEDIPAIAV